MMPNPRIHLLLVLALAASLPWMAWQSLLIVSLLLLAWHLSRGRLAMRGLGHGLWRLKWLLLALALVYLWLAETTDWLAAAAEAGRRMGILLLMFATVHTLLFRLSTRELAGLLILALRPLDRVGLPGTRFGRRLGMLVGQAGPERQKLARRRPESGHWLSWLPRILAAEVRRVEAAAMETHAEPDAAGTPPPRPGWRDWRFAFLGLALIAILLIWPHLPPPGGIGV